MAREQYTVKVVPSDTVRVEVDMRDGGDPHVFDLSFESDEDGVLCTINTGPQVALKFEDNEMRIRSWA